MGRGVTKTLVIATALTLVLQCVAYLQEHALRALLQLPVEAPNRLCMRSGQSCGSSTNWVQLLTRGWDSNVQP